MLELRLSSISGVCFGAQTDGPEIPDLLTVSEE
jgi:hypothetical protein